MTPRAFTALHGPLLAAGAGAAVAQAYPVKQLRLIVPFAPGGPNDLLGRLVGQKLTEAWGEAVVIENRGGAGGTVAAGRGGQGRAGRLYAGDGLDVQHGGSA